MIADLIHSGVIADSKMAYFDVRPSAHAPTLELRTRDACPMVDDAVLVAGLFRATVRAARAEHRGRRAVRSVPRRRSTARRSGGPPAAVWRASCWTTAGTPNLARRQVVRRARNDCARSWRELSDLDEVERAAPGTLARGNSADRQRAAIGRAGSAAATWSSWWSARPRADRGTSPPSRPWALPLPGRRRGGRAQPPPPTRLPTTSSSHFREPSTRGAGGAQEA